MEKREKEENSRRERCEGSGGGTALRSSVEQSP